MARSLVPFALLFMPACASVTDPVDTVTSPSAEASFAETATETRTVAGPHREVVIKSESDRPNFSPAIRSGNFLFLSGAVGLAEGKRELVPGGIQPETKRSLERIQGNLGRAGLGLGDVVKCTVYLADIKEFGAMNEVYRQVWPGDPPTRTTVAVSGLALDSRVEIECLAAYPG